MGGVWPSPDGDDDEILCGAKSKQHGRPCRKKKGWATDHVGYGRCKYHGGMSPSGKKSAAKEQAMEEMERARQAVMGQAIDVHPMDALLWCVRITAGEV